jgi:hypothetical protein
MERAATMSKPCTLGSRRRWFWKIWDSRHGLKIGILRVSFYWWIFYRKVMLFYFSVVSNVGSMLQASKPQPIVCLELRMLCMQWWFVLWSLLWHYSLVDCYLYLRQYIASKVRVAPKFALTKCCPLVRW